jgi:hypothetical protein
MIEIAKRLPPTFTTLRDLFLRSGNECAFPGCDRRLVNHKGQWVGEVCHIEAALPGGQRFNAAMSNEARRARTNLLLLCHDHHVETDDLEEFPVVVLQKMKAAHEAQFSAPPPLSEEQLEKAVQDIVAASIEDVTDRIVLHLPQTMARFNAVFGIDETPEEAAGTIENMLRPRFEALRKLPVDTRAAFAILMDRSPAEHRIAVPVHELEMVTNTDPLDFSRHVEILERYGLAWLDESWQDDRPVHWVLTANEIDGWDFWQYFRDYCGKVEAPIKEVIGDLRFDVLDG